MQLVSDQMRTYLAGSSMIRKMFEAGIELRKKFGADHVFDFSLGNPDLPPPPEVKTALAEITASVGNPFALGYMPNAGFPLLREKLAEKVSAEQQCKVPGDHLILTCGAAGGLNVFFRAVLTPGDEVVCPSPYFVEYDFYAANFGGKLVTAPSKDLTFELDIDAFRKAITPKTKVVIINSPNNPTGYIYGRAELEELARLIAEREAEYGHPIFVISDEPYRFLNFAGAEIPPVFGIFRHAAVIGSCSKNLSLAGERIGYIALSPNFDGGELLGALILCNRILGFVNAPVVGQKILLACLDAQVDPEIYRERRDAMAKVLSDAGIEFTMPRGAFYFFAKSPVPDEREFVNALLNENVLVVPGRGFGRAGYFRATFCVDKKVIERSGEGFKRAVAALK